MQCPGQDNRYWDGEAVFEIPCPNAETSWNFLKMIVSVAANSVAKRY